MTTIAIIRCGLIAFGAVFSLSQAAAQVRTAPPLVLPADQDNEPAPVRSLKPLEPNPASGTAQSAAGQVGQRQTREASAARAGIEPMARINSRIQNRVQNRVQNRIGPGYDPQASATNPFAVAEDQARVAGRPR